MEINDALIDHLAHLSRLEFSGTDREAIIKDLGRILDFCQQLNRVDTGDLEPLIYMTEGAQNLRDDIPKQLISHADALRNAPLKDSDYFKVPKFIEK